MANARHDSDTARRTGPSRATNCASGPPDPAGDRYEVWQVPSAATPQVQNPVRIAGLEGRNLELVQHRILRILAEQRIRLVGSPGRTGFSRPVPEVLAVRLGLIFRTLAPMRDRDRMWAVADGIEKMEREEAAYWLGMAIHREHPRRVLAGLRLLLTGPREEVAATDLAA